MHYQTIQSLSRKIRNGEFSPVDVVDASLKRIASLNPGLNAFITVLSDEARASAGIAEEEIRTGKWRGPLHGIPVGVKDFYDTKGVRTTCGSAAMKDRVADRDAAAVTKLEAAGAVIIGKTNMDALGMATTGLTSHFGPVRNPWNVAYVSGGSSAGSAVAVASGMCYATLDTDAVGSVRLPAACCGVVGFKGSYGLISTRGILGDEPVDDFIRWMAHAGVTTRDAGDTALVLDALATHPEAGFAQAVTDARHLRIGVGQNVHAGAAVAKAFNAAVEVVARFGYPVSDAAVPLGDPSQGSFASIEKDRRDIGEEAFSEVDVILLPTTLETTPTVRTAEQDPEQAVSAEITAFANYFGLPAASVPCGFDSLGMPIGLQIVARPGADARVLAVAAAYQGAAGLAPRHPPM